MKRLLSLLVLLAVPAAAQWTPASLDNKRLWVESTTWTASGGPWGQMNDRCTASNDPYNCCTGDGTGTCPTNKARLISTCDTQSCYDNNAENSLIEDQYCDMVGGAATDARELWNEGCVAYWEDMSGQVTSSAECSTCTSGTDYKCCGKNTSYPGVEIGMDDLEKPGFISECINGLPCARMYPCDDSECDVPIGSTTFPQNTGRRF
jgi:hypothetical protein